MTRDEAIAHIGGKFEDLGARIKELEAGNAGLARIVSAQAEQIASLQADKARIDRLDVIRACGAPGAWSTVLLALREVGDGRGLRDAIDALAEPDFSELVEYAKSREYGNPGAWASKVFRLRNERKGGK